MAESKEWRYLYMITLTYSNENVPMRRVYPFYYTFLDEHNQEQKRVFKTRKSAELSFSRAREEGVVLLTSIVDSRKVVSKGLNEFIEPKYRHFDKEHYLHYLNPDWKEGEVRKVPTVCLDDVQRFFKRFRRHLEYRAMDSSMKYFMSSEYGDHTLRPHYHIILFSNERIEHIKPAVRHTWDLGSVDDIHLIDSTYKGKVVSEMSAFLYTSKYVSKPSYVENPYVVAGYIDKPFYKVSKGIGRTQRDNEWRRIVSPEMQVAFDKSDSMYRSRFENILYNNGGKHVYYKDEHGVEFLADGPLYQLYDVKVSAFNGISVELFKDFQFYSKQWVYMNGKTVGYASPRYFMDVLKPYNWVEEYVYNEIIGKDEKKKFKRIDATCPWYIGYKAYLEYCHIQCIYQSLCQSGEINDKTSRRTILFKIQSQMDEVDEERYREALRREYESYASRQF